MLIHIVTINLVSIHNSYNIEPEKYSCTLWSKIRFPHFNQKKFADILKYVFTKVNHFCVRHLTPSHTLQINFVCNLRWTQCKIVILRKHICSLQHSPMKRWYENFETRSWFIQYVFAHVFERYIIDIYVVDCTVQALTTKIRRGHKCNIWWSKQK